MEEGRDSTRDGVGKGGGGGEEGVQYGRCEGKGRVGRSKEKNKTEKKRKSGGEMCLTAGKPNKLFVY